MKPDDLRAFLDDRFFDFHTLDDRGFQDWLSQKISWKLSDPIFAAQVRRRELIRANRARLTPLFDTVESCGRSYSESSHREAFEQLEYAIAGSRRAIQGLTRVIEESQGERRLELEEKRAGFTARLEAHEDRWIELSSRCPERAALNAAKTALEKARAETGLDAADEELARLRRDEGRHTTTRGKEFEALALGLLEEEILPTLLADPKTSMHVLTNVTLGCARAEFDALIVQGPTGKTNHVHVAAVVEAKRNINDIPWGFQMRQENLAWFTGDTASYDPELYRNASFPTGHFDRAATLDIAGRPCRFDRGSFSGFQRDTASGHFLDGLIFVASNRRLQGMRASDLGRILHRVATDLGFSLEDATYLHELREWSQELVDRFQARDVLELYARNPERAKGIWLI